MRLDTGQQSLNSYAGTILTILLATTMINFTFLKADVLINKKDVDVLSTINEDIFTSDTIYNYDNGFNVAAAITAFDSETEYILDATYG